MTDEEYLNHPLVKVLYEIIAKTNCSFGKNILMDSKYDNLCIDFIDKIDNTGWEEYNNKYWLYTDKEDREKILVDWGNCFIEQNKDNYTLRIDGVFENPFKEVSDYFKLLDNREDVFYEREFVSIGIDFIRKKESNIDCISRVYYTLLNYFYGRDELNLHIDFNDLKGFIDNVDLDSLSLFYKNKFPNYYITNKQYELFLFTLADKEIFNTVYNSSINNTYKLRLLHAFGIASLRDMCYYDNLFGSRLFIKEKESWLQDSLKLMTIGQIQK